MSESDLSRLTESLNKTIDFLRRLSREEILKEVNFDSFHKLNRNQLAENLAKITNDARGVLFFIHDNTRRLKDEDLKKEIKDCY
ncbi:MAG: hypothetical protein BWZ03_00080 [bacterium ADurb.BinA186]|nr:MAG: hypothetical protein BWZ03_00080 [bacterium ADurb.BinA186]